MNQDPELYYPEQEQPDETSQPAELLYMEDGPKWGGT